MTRCPFHPAAHDQEGKLIPPRPKGRAKRASALVKLMFGRTNLFSALNDKLYRGWLGESNLLVHKAFLVNQPDLVRKVLVDEVMDYPKSPVMRRALEPLLGRSVFLTNGALWQRQRRMIDPAFVGGKVRQVFGVMRECADDMAARFEQAATGEPVEIDPEMTHVTADVIFRTLFSVPIAQQDAQQVFEAFGRYQRAAPFASLRSLLGLGSVKRNSAFDTAGKDIRALLLPFIERRQAEIEAGTAPDDLATGILTTADPETGHRFDAEEMLDQVAIFFLAGHETSATALTWALYLIAMDADVQARMRTEAREVLGDRPIEFADLRQLSFTRDVFREAMRLYPPVPFFVRRATKASVMRDRKIPVGSSVILAPWYLQRHERLWENPHRFDPDRWASENGKERARDAYIPFSIGARVCPGAAFALQEGVIILAELMRRFSFEPVAGHEPVPVMQVTLRAGNGVLLKLRKLDEETA
ncbi:MAG: cytochrome P450 [Neomegalonema sp.]|nr:cytochrome P450 [Neomegalonema sp.]